MNTTGDKGHCGTKCMGITWAKGHYRSLGKMYHMEDNL